MITASSGYASLPGSRFVVTLTDPLVTPIMMGGTIMHELGHNLGLKHYSGGGKNPSYTGDYQPNYFSVMSYVYQFWGLLKVSAPMTPYLDYSRGAVAAINESAVNESHGFRSVPISERFAEQFIPRIVRTSGGVKVRHTLLTGACVIPSPSTDYCPVDFDLDQLISYQSQIIQLDPNDNSTTFQQSRDDWSQLKFSGVTETTARGATDVGYILDELENVSALSRRLSISEYDQMDISQSALSYYISKVSSERISDFQILTQANHPESVVCNPEY